MKNQTFKVIDGDNLCLLETFIEAERDEILQRYKNNPKWNDVDFDIDDDLICFRES